MKRGRPTYREQVTASVKADAMYAALAGKPAVLAAEMLAPARKRAAPKPSGVPLEREVLAEVLQALRAHPNVAGVWRISAGTFKDGDRYIRAAPKGFPDIHFLCVNGRAGYCEVKSPVGKVTSEQAEFLAAAKANGAVAFVARSASDVHMALR